MPQQYGRNPGPNPGPNAGPPPMPPEAAPPAGPDAGPAPEAGMAPTPEDMMASVEQEQIARAQEVMAALPEPEEPLEVKLLQKILDKLNELAVSVAGEDMVVPITWEAPDEKKINMLPPEVAVPLVMAVTVIQEIGGAAGLDVSKYSLDPTELASNAGLRKAAGVLDMIMKDKDLVAALGPPPEGEEAPPADEMPTDFEEDEEALMEMM